MTGKIYSALILVVVALQANALNTKIVGGDEVKPHSLPYMVALETTINYKDIVCGASLINESWVLTAARCVNGSSEVELIFGAHDIFILEITQTRKLSSQIIVHEDFDGQNNDIALVKLETPVTLNENIALVTLPQKDDDFTEKLGIIAGWGKTQDTDETTSRVLFKTEATVISTIICQVPYLFQLNFNQICTTGSGLKNICKGDTGGPLIVDGVQAGIASFGTTFGCQVGFPSVYTRVPSYLDWIANVTSTA